MRPSWKLPYISLKLFKKKVFFKTRIRNSTIPQSFGQRKQKVEIYNGIWYKSKSITPNMVGLKLGELSYTKPIDRKTHIKKKKKDKKRKEKKNVNNLDGSFNKC